VRQVVEALGAVHAVGVVHRDLKLDNIHVSEVVGDRDVVKVLDFGLAKVAGASRLTRAGMVFGTPHYMSPEQAMGDPVDHRTDIYALGVVMYEMFTARVPFEADSYMGVLTKHMYVAPTPPSQLMGGAKELGALEVITLRCLEKKPQNRFATMSDLLDELDRIVQLNEGGEIEVQPSSSAPGRGVKNLLADELEAPSAEELRVARELSGPHVPSLRTLVRAGIGAGGALVLAFFAWWVGRSMSAPDPAAADPPPVESAGPPPERVIAPLAAAEPEPAAAPASIAAPEPPVPASRSGSPAEGRRPLTGQRPASQHRGPSARSPASKKPKQSSLGAG